MSLKKDLIDRQARFWVLMAGGATLRGASEAVGVSRATGRKWRQATGGRIPRTRVRALTCTTARGRYRTQRPTTQDTGRHHTRKSHAASTV
jgi:hypothetical protein